MKLVKTLSCLAAVVCANSAFADVKLNFPDTVDVLIANEYSANASSGGLFSSTKTVTLPDGVNQIVFRYTPYFEEGNERVTVSSDPIIARFDSANSELEFKLPKYRDARQAEKMLKNLEWSLVDGSGQEVAVTEDKLIKHGFQLNRDLQRETQDYNRKGQGVAVIALAEPVSNAPVVQQAAPVVTEKPDTPAPQASGDTAEEMLHFWYEKADDETKARFKAFVNKK